ncbi:MAG: ferric reductase-like transmembrane domain-containing protein [Rhodobacteraceae bacterium]|nr:ferric reductase-like transmembrane domain-containing protein [Paracoccaceae bacterium]
MLGRATVWIVLAGLLIVPIGLAAFSPLLEWRQPVYIGAGFAGIVAMALLVLQPLLVLGVLAPSSSSGYSSGAISGSSSVSRSGKRGRRLHRWIGGALVLCVVVHVAGLLVTSPPDVIDALLLRAPTLFSDFGVIAMWAVFAVALLVIFRRRLRPRHWRAAHLALAIVMVGGSVAHAILIEGTMETISKTLLCLAVLLATARVVIDMRPWRKLRRE